MRRNPAAGGFFLVIAILGGFALGVARGQPLPFTLLGTGVGALAATIVWLVDRRRPPRA